MNILHLNTLDKIGGAAKNAYRIHQACQLNGHRSKMLVGHLTGQEQNIFKLEEFRPNRLKSWLGFDGFFGSKALPYHPLVQEADLVHLHNLHGNYLNLETLKLLTIQKPVVWTVNDMWPMTGHCAHSFECLRWQTGCGQCPQLNTYPILRFDLTHWLWLKKKNIYRQSKLTLVVPSQWLQQKMEKSMLRGKRCEVIYNGIDEKIFKPFSQNQSRKELKLPKDVRIVCFVAHGGLNNFFKGGHYFKKVAAGFKLRKNVLFLEIGSNKRTRRRQGNLLRIPYLKNEKNMAKYYSSSDVLILTSQAENCPLTVLEAMACGLPVVAFDVGGIKELAIHQKTGWIAANKNIKSLQKGLSLLLANRQMRKNFGKQARKRFQKFFTLKRQTQTYLCLYEELL